MNFDLLIRNARVVSLLGVNTGEIAIKDGRIAAIVTPGSQLSALSTGDAGGKYVMPGTVDPHVHLGLGHPFATDLQTETRAAAAGRITTIGIHLKVKSENLRGGIQQQVH